MHTALEVYRAFDPAAVRPAQASGLDLTGYDVFRLEARTAGPFHATAAFNINAGEAFFAEALAFVRDGQVEIASPFGAGRLTTRDVVTCPATPWDTVPLYVARFAAPEPMALVKRGLSWCTTLGLVFPRRRLFVSFQSEDRRMAQDVADVAHAEQWFTEQGVEAFARTSPDTRRPACLLLTSEHFAHHLWNELSVLDGLVAAEAHHGLHVLVNRAPIAPLTALFPELPPDCVEAVSGPPDAPMRLARERGWAVVPAGRRHLPETLVERVLRVARQAHPESASAARAFRARHDLVLWLTLRLEARTATNLVDALTQLVIAVRAQHRGLGVIVDGFTTPAGVETDWNHAVIARERDVIPILQRGLGGQPHVVLVGRPTTEALVWAAIADYYVTPYGTAQHKVAWINPIPGLVHAGENKRAVSTTDAGPYARQAGPPPSFFFSPVTRRDATSDLRQDLLSYELDVDAFVRHALDDIAARVAARRSSA